MKKLIFMLMALAATLGAAAQTDRTATSDEEIYQVVENDPEFENGMEGLYQYLATNIVYPPDAREEKVSGKVLVSFVIEKDGSVSNVKVLRSPDERLSREAERVIKAMPKWKPGRQGGKKVRVQYALPIQFKL